MVPFTFATGSSCSQTLVQSRSVFGGRSLSQLVVAAHGPGFQAVRGTLPAAWQSKHHKAGLAAVWRTHSALAR
jgi:hypothetical protein